MSNRDTDDYEIRNFAVDADEIYAPPLTREQLKEHLRSRHPISFSLERKSIPKDRTFGCGRRIIHLNNFCG